MRNIYNLTNNKEDEIIAFFMACNLFWGLVSGIFIQTVRQIIILPMKIDTFIIYGMIMILAMKILYRILNNIRIVDIILFLTLNICLLVSLLISQEYISYFISLLFSLNGINLWQYCVCRGAKKYELIYRYIGIGSIITVFAQWINFLFFTQTTLSESYSQYFGYLSLPIAVVSISNLFYHSRGKILYLFSLVSAILFLLASGARGPLVCLIMFIILKAVRNMQTIKQKIGIIAVLSFLAIYILIFGLDGILLQIRDLFISVNLNTRSVDALLNKTMLNDEARNNLMHISLKIISDSPFWGIGLGRDRLAIANMYLSNKDDFQGWYPHNLFLEIFVQFGIIMGIAIICLLIYLLYRGLKFSRCPAAANVFEIYCACGVFPLLFSGSYLLEPLFFATVALSINTFYWRNNIGEKND